MNQDELAHFGVKGMRWGIRKSRPAVSSAGGKKSAKKTITPAQKKAARAKAKAEAAARDTTTLTKSEEAAANLTIKQTAALAAIAGTAAYTYRVRTT